MRRPRFFLWEWLRFAILPMLSFSGSKVCCRWLNYVEVVNINLRFCHIFTSSHYWPFSGFHTENFTRINCRKLLQEKPFPWNTHSWLSWLKQYKFLSLFFKRVLPMTPIKSYCLINTPKKVKHPDLFVGCDRKSNKIQAIRFLLGFFTYIYSAQLFWVP